MWIMLLTVTLMATGQTALLEAVPRFESREACWMAGEEIRDRLGHSLAEKGLSVYVEVEACVEDGNPA